VELQFHRSLVERLCGWLSLVSAVVLLVMQATFVALRAHRLAARRSAGLGMPAS
jgi:hypothetical protein